MENNEFYFEPTFDEKPAKKTFSRLFLAFFTFVVLENVFAIALQLIVYQIAPALLEASWFTIILTIVVIYGMAGPITYWILKTMPTEAPRTQVLSKSAFIRFLFIGFALLIAGSLIGVRVNEVITTITGMEQESAVTNVLTSSDLWLSVLYACVIAPIMEEFFFRKLLIDRIHIYGTFPSILFSGLAFGLYHGNIEQFFYAFLVGMLFAIVYIYTGNMWYSVAIHSIINFFGGILITIVQNIFPEITEALTLEETELTNFVMDHSFEFLCYMGAALLPYAFALVGLILFIRYRREMLGLFGSWELIPKGKRFHVSCLNVGFILFFFACLTVMTIYIFS